MNMPSWARRQDEEIAHMIRSAVADALPHIAAGSVVVINRLHIQVNYASGGGATVRVES